MIKFLTHILFFFFIFCGYAQNQDIKFGVSGSTQIIQTTRFLDSIYQPENSGFTYQEPSEGEGVINRSHVFNSFSLGAQVSYTLKKSTFTIEPQYFMQRSIFRFEKESYSERVVGMRAFRLPLFYSFKLFKKKNSMFLTLGTILTAAKNYDFQHPGSGYLFSDGLIYNGGVDYGDDHFSGILYTNDLYWQHFFGVGKNLGDFKLSFRFISRSVGSSDRIAAQIGQLEMCLSYTVFGISDLQKKRSIYHE